MAHRLILAHDDILRRPSTRFSLRNVEIGAPFMPAQGWLSDDLGSVTLIHTARGIPAVRFQFLRALPVSVIGLLNMRVAGANIETAYTVTPLAYLRLGSTIVLTQSMPFVSRPSSLIDLDRYVVPSAPVTATSLEIEFAGTSRPLTVGRIFCATGLRLSGGPEGGLESGWTASVMEAKPDEPGITGALRPQPTATGRRITFTASGMNDAMALGTTAAATHGGPIIEPAYGLADLQLRAGNSKPVLAMLRASDATPTQHRIAAFGRIVEPFTIEREAGSPQWSARFTVQEANR